MKREDVTNFLRRELGAPPPRAFPFAPNVSWSDDTAGATYMNAAQTLSGNANP